MTSRAPSPVTPPSPGPDPTDYIRQTTACIGPSFHAYALESVVKALSHEMGRGEAMRVTRRTIAWVLDAFDL